MRKNWDKKVCRYAFNWSKQRKMTKMRQKWDKLFNKIYTVTVQGVKTTRTTVRLPVGTKKNIPSNFDVIGTLGRYIISCWVLRAACFYTYSNEVMYAQQFSMMMNKMNQSRRENVKVDIKLEKCISTSNPTFLTTAVHSICAYLSFCPKLYIQSTINIWKKLLSTAIWANKNGLVSGRIACISSKKLRPETI